MPYVQRPVAPQRSIKCQPVPAPACQPVDAMDRPNSGGRASTGPSRSRFGGVDEDHDLARLVAAMAAGDEQALALLYQRTSARLRAVSMRLVRRSDLADELLADTYWQAWRQADRFQAQRGPVMAWLVTILRTRGIDEMRRMGARPMGQLIDYDLDRLACGDLHADPQHRLAHLQLRRLVESALERLSAQMRQLLCMALFGGMSHDEISHATRLPLGTVKSQIRRGLQRIKALLSGPLGLQAQT